MMDLDNAPEPVRQIAVVVTAVLTIVGVTLTAVIGSLDTAPHWLVSSSAAITAAVGILAHWVGAEKARSVVTPAPHVASLLAHSEPVVEPADVDPVAAPEPVTSLDQAAVEAGLV